MLLYLWGFCRSSLTRIHSAWPARSWCPGLLQRIASRCSSSGQSSGMRTETQAKSKQIVLLSIRREVGGISSLLTASPSLHFQLPLSNGFLRFSPIQNQCCSWSSDSLWANSSLNIVVSVVRHVSPGQRLTLTQRPRGGSAGRSAPPRGCWCSAGWPRVSGRSGELAASSASSPAGRNETPAPRRSWCH